MNSQNKNPVIDADAHVVECAHTWDFMEGAPGWSLRANGQPDGF